MPKISVIIPIYNTEKYLRECLDSILNQTLEDIEVICVNDGSTDNSINILEECAKHDRRIKIITTKNQGAGEARNEGFKHAVSKYVIFFDSDDYMDLNALETLYLKAEETVADVTVCEHKSLDDSTQKVTSSVCNINYRQIDFDEVFSPKKHADFIFQFAVGWPWDKLYLREFILNNNISFQSLRHANDTFFVLFSLAVSKKIAIVKQKLIIHRTRNSSLAYTRETAPECFYWALKELYERLTQAGLYETYQRSFINYCIEFSFWHISTIKGQKTKAIMLKYINQMFKELKIANYETSYFYKPRFYRYLLKYNLKPLQKIFSVRNQGVFKIIFFLGMEFKIKLSKLVEREYFIKQNERFKELEDSISRIKNELGEEICQKYQ